MTQIIRPPVAGERAAIRTLLVEAFDGPAEAQLVERLVAEGDCVSEQVAVEQGAIVGHVLFSRLMVDDDDRTFDAVALAPLAVASFHRRRGIGGRLVQATQEVLRQRGEALFVVLGDPAYYQRFGYEHARAAGFSSDYQCDALQALAMADAPTTGRLVYAPAFAAL